MHQFDFLSEGYGYGTHTASSSSLPHLACIQVRSIHKHDLMTLLDATNQYSQFPCCEQCSKPCYLQTLQEPDHTCHSTKRFHTGSSASWPTLSSLSLKAEHQSSSLSHKESQPEGSCLLPRGSLLWRMQQGRMEVSAWQTGPLPTLFGQQCLAGKVQGELVAMNLLMDTHTHTQAHCKRMCTLTYTHWCIYVHKLTVLHIWWIPPAGFYIIRYSTDAKIQFIHLPMPPLGKSSTPESSSRLPQGAWWFSVSLNLSLPALLSVVLSFQHFSFFSAPIPVHFCDFHPAKISYEEIMQFQFNHFVSFDGHSVCLYTKITLPYY